MKTIPLNLNVEDASALYILLDAALKNLEQEQSIISQLKEKPTLDSPPLSKLIELSETLDPLIQKGKELSLEVGAIVDELTPDEEPFQAFK